MSETAANMKSPKVALMQPLFMPWLGYFGLVRDADIFVFLDDFQFVRRHFYQRNQFFVSGGNSDIAGFPVEHSGSQDMPINESKLQLDDKTRRKFLAMFQHNYKGTPFYGDVYGWLEEWINEDHANLAAMNMAFIRKVADILGFKPEFRHSSAMDTSGGRSEKIESLLRQNDARTYLSAKGSFEYMREDGVFPLEGIDVYFQDFQPVPYEQQQSSTFVSHLSVIDALMQAGPEATAQNINESAQPYKSWDEMNV